MFHGLLLTSFAAACITISANVQMKDDVNQAGFNRWRILPNDTSSLKQREKCHPNCPQDCKDVYDLGNTKDGLYVVYVSTDDMKPMIVYCDMQRGGWLVFQRRVDGATDFYNNWIDYAAGFGDLLGEFWIGNDALYLLTAQKPYRLRIDMEDFSGSKTYAEYNNFVIGSSLNKYALSIGTYTGAAGDSLTYHNNMQFSTPDQDNDVWTSHCARDNCCGGWWYRTCAVSNLNGLYNNVTTSTSNTNVFWNSWKSAQYPLKFTEMKFSPM